MKGYYATRDVHSNGTLPVFRKSLTSRNSGNIAQCHHGQSAPFSVTSEPQKTLERANRGREIHALAIRA